MPSATSLAPPTVEQWGQVMAMVQQDLSNAQVLIAQKVSYVQQQWEHLLGIASNVLTPSLGSTMPQGGSGMESGRISTTTVPAAASLPPTAHKAKGLTSNGPNIVGEGPFLWDPPNPAADIDASNPVNWLLNGTRQKPAGQGGIVPGTQAGDTAIFDPGDGFIHDGNGNAAINWDYQAKFSTMQLGGKYPYTGLQTIKSGITVELTGVNASNASLTVPYDSSNLNLDFIDGTAKFQIDSNATITNMTLAGDRNGQFIINGGTTKMAQATTYTETIGVIFNINQGAIVNDQSNCPLKFTNNNLPINVYGTMQTFYGTSILIDYNNFSNDYINVNGGTLSYAGKSGTTNYFTVPVLVRGGGTFKVLNGQDQPLGGTLIVQNQSGYTFPNNQKNSVYMTDVGSTVQLSQQATLECDNDYYQSLGTLETMDGTTCTLQDGSQSNGTTTIAGGYLKINQPNQNAYGTLNVNCGTLNFAGTYYVAINAPAQGAGSCDLLNVTGTTNLQGASLYV